MTEKKTFYNFTVLPRKVKPIAKITPEDTLNAIGASILLDGRGSYDPDGGELTFQWRFKQVPLGSAVEQSGFKNLGSKFELVSFVPDKIGLYIIELIVNDGDLDSDPDESFVYIQLALSPLCSEQVEDASFIWNSLSDFWSKVEHRAKYESYWSTMIQAVANELLHAYQVDYAKSISTIPDYLQKRWIKFEPHLSILEEDNYLVIGNESCGDDLVTGSLGITGKLLIKDKRRLQVLNGTASPLHVGRTIELLTSNGSNAGTYEIVGVTGNAYLLSPYTLVPSVIDEQLFDGLSSALKDTKVLSTSGLFSLPVAPRKGDVVFVNGGLDAGYYIIESFTDTTVTVNKTFKNGFINVPTQILYCNEYKLSDVEETYTKVVSVPSSTVDFRNLDTIQISGVCNITGAKEIQLPNRYVSDGLIGKVLTVKEGINRGSYKILKRIGKGDSFEVGAAFKLPLPNFNVPFEITSQGSSSNRLIHIERMTEVIDKVFHSDVLNRSGINLSVPSQIAKRENLKWRVPNVLVSSKNLEKEGVREGDVLVLDIYQEAFPDKIVNAYVHITGVNQNKAGFVWSREEPELGVIPWFSDTEILRLAKELGIEGVTQGNSGLLYTGMGSAVQFFLKSRAFKNTYFNVPITEFTNFVLGSSVFHIRPSKIIRHSRIRVSDEVMSIPCLREYIKPPVTANIDGEFYLSINQKLAPVSSVTPTLRENADYVIEDEGGVFGVDAQLVGGSSEVKLPYAALIDRDVEEGDSLKILDGFNIGIYKIVAILDQETVRVFPSLKYTQTATYEISRQLTGKFIRFVPGIFNGSALAPEFLWGETVMFDNYKAIENNFGFAVNLVKSDFDKLVNIPNYRLAVAGVMYSWATGNSLASLEIGANILFGLPFTEVNGYINDIDFEFKTDSKTGEPSVGRILLEEADELRRTGRIRAYFFKPPIFKVDPATGLKYQTTDKDTTGLAVNPVTNKVYDVGDYVKQFSPLTKGCSLKDYIDEPNWFVTGTGSRISEIRKVHTFQVKVGQEFVTLENTEFVHKFLRAVKSVWTNFLITIILYLLDTITVDEHAKILGRLKLYETPGFGIEACARLNNYNESCLHNIYYSGLSPTGFTMTRTLRHGYKLRTEQGVSIAYGENFIYPPSYAPVDYPLTKIGDVLIIMSGPNKGWYLINDVYDDNRIDLSITHFFGVHPSHLVSCEQEYQIIRPQHRIVTQGSGLIQVTGDDVVRDNSATFWIDGVEAGDTLVIVDGANKGRYRIEELIVPIPPEKIVTYLKLSSPLGATTTSDYFIEREALITNPVQNIRATITALDRRVPINALDDLAISAIEEEDYFGCNGYFYKIIHIDRVANDIFIDPPPLDNYVGTLTIMREIVAGTFDFTEKALPLDAVQMTLIPFNPAANQVDTNTADADVVLTAPDPDVMSSLIPGDKLELLAPSLDEGIYTILDIALPDTLTLSQAMTDTNTCDYKLIRKKRRLT